MNTNELGQKELFLMTDFGLHYVGDETHVIVPEVLDGRPVTMIAHEGFANKSLHSIELPYTLKEIGSSAFRQCEQLEHINIPLSVERIAGGAFQGCRALKEVWLHDRIVEIGSYAFDECVQLTAIKLPKEIEYIGAYAFSDTALSEVVLPEGIQQLANSLFFNCQQLHTVTLPSTVEMIGSCAFAGCIALQAIAFPPSLHIIQEGAFEFCTALQTITFHSLLQIAEPTAFLDCPSISHIIAPFTPETAIERYDEQRHIFRNDSQRLAELPREELVAAQLFTASTHYEWQTTTEQAIKQEVAVTYNLLEQAQQAAIANDFETACTHLATYSTSHPLDPHAHLLLGQIHYKQGDFINSIHAYREAIANGIGEVIYVHLGHALLDASMSEATIAHYSEHIWHYTEHERYDVVCIEVAKKAALLSL